MAGSEESGKSRGPSIEDLQQWLTQELRDLEKARELRIKEATGIVDSVVKGKLTPSEGFHLTNEYEDRWGEAIPGACALPNLTDEQLIARIDQARIDDDDRTDRNRRRLRRLDLDGPSDRGRS